jgi:hypothetical protein
MKKKRNSAYYKARLAKEHPSISAQIRPRGPLSVRAASAKAGLIHLPTRLDALKREWKKAVPAEQREFVRWLKARHPRTHVAPPPPIVDSTGRLRPDVAKFLSDWVKTNRSKPGRIMKQMGFRVFDWRLAHAIDHGGVLPHEVIDKLQPWMMKNGFPR